MATEYKKSLPHPVNYAVSKPFWEGAKRHELMMPRCKRCGHYFFYPREECPDCLSMDLEWVKVSGKARLHTFTVVTQPANPSFREDVPYIYAIVQLEEGPKMISNVIGCPVEEVKIDMPLETVFEDVTPEWTLVKFKPVS